MLPIIAIVGRPNVGKSTFFNRLTGTRDALVADFSGLTRDRIYGHMSHQSIEAIMIDTGGLVHDHGDLSEVIQGQTKLAIEESDLILFLVDAKKGLIGNDEEIARRLRKENKPIILVVNKAEGVNREESASDFFSLGLGEPQCVSALRGDNCEGIKERIFELLQLKIDAVNRIELPETSTSIALIGRPNVGKSTFINSIIREDRLLTQNQPGTTRDTIHVDFQYQSRDLVLIDTAGIRRRKNIRQNVEKFSIVKALQAIELSDSVIVLIDGVEGITDQDSSLIGLVLKNERALTIAVNKSDALDEDQLQVLKRNIDRKLRFVNFVDINNVSALENKNLDPVLSSAIDAADAACLSVPTKEISKLIESLILSNPPPSIQGRRIKLKYAHQGGSQPPIFIVYGNQTNKIPESYRRFLINQIRKKFGFWGTPIRLEFRNSTNPYAEKKNKLSLRQWRKRKRIIRLRKKK
jgi:GTP-binding protein